MPFPFCPALSTTGCSHPPFDSLQPEWQDDTLYVRLHGYLDAPTFIAAGFMWGHTDGEGKIHSIPGMILADRRIA